MDQNLATFITIVEQLQELIALKLAFVQALFEIEIDEQERRSHAGGAGVCGIDGVDGGGGGCCFCDPLDTLVELPTAKLLISLFANKRLFECDDEDDDGDEGEPFVH